MSIVSYIVIALAFGIMNMLLFRRCVEASKVRLSLGLLMSFGVAFVHALFLWFGAWLGSALRFELAGDPAAFQSANNWIFFALALFVSVRGVFPYLRREPRLTVFSLAGFGRVLLMAFATGINVFLIGLGIGYADSAFHAGRCIWPMLILCTLLGFLGVMFGRQLVPVRQRRWAFVAMLMILGVAVAALFSI